MNKSQLRLLAAEVADGNIPASEYRARRRELIDNIVAGVESIERVPPQWAARDDTGADDDDVTTVNNRIGNIPATPEGPRFSVPFPALLGVGSLLCIAILAALLWPGDDPEPVAPALPPVPMAEEISPVRGLVESFVARRDFSPDAIREFQTDWQKFDAGQRDEARGALWFGSLVRAIRDEVKTQKALAGLASGEAAMARAKAAFALGDFLGVADQLPDVDDIAQPATVDASPLTAAISDPDTAPPSAAGSESPSASAPSQGHAQNAQATTPTVSDTTTSASTPATALPAPTRPTGQQWLAAQNDTDLTLQIFAVNNLDRVEQLIGAYPDLDVNVLASDGAVPRYRVFHGVFDDETAARQAYEALPSVILSASQGAIVKSFSVVRDDLRAQTVASTPEATNTDPDAFAVQIFATGNRANAQALIQAFPALNLQLREITGDATPYRVVYGRFESADVARSAASALPETLLSRIGTPLPKPISSLGSAAPP